MVYVVLQSKRVLDQETVSSTACPTLHLTPSDERQLRRRLAGWAYRFLGLPRAEFDDVYQGAWRKLRETEHRGSHTRNLEAALRWNIRNCWLEELRRRRRHPTASLENVDELASRPAPDVVEHLEQLEAARYLFRTLKELTQLQREVLVLRDVCGLGVDEICLRLGISRHAYREEHAAALRSAYDRLRALLGCSTVP
jgi:RNA polymerase sigma factor (sigma-70 family)